MDRLVGCAARVLLLLAAFGSAPTLHGNARAQAAHTLNLGGRASGMGTAYTAIADDGTAAFYNPGGLGYGERTRVTANVTLNSFERILIDDFLTTPWGKHDLTERSDPSIPIFTAISRSFGKRDEYGRPMFTAAFTAFTLDRSQFSGEIREEDPEGRTLTALYDRSYQSPFYGLSFAWNAPNDWGLGVSGFLTPRTLKHQEIVVVPYGGSPSPSFPYFEGGNLLSRNSRLEIKSYDVVFRFGILKKIGERWSIGITGQPPGWRVTSKTSLRFQYSAMDADATPAQGTFVFFDETFPSSMPLPWELRVGTAHRFKRRLMVSADVQMIGAISDRDAVRVPPIQGIEDEIPPTGVFFDGEGKRNLVVNAYLGADIEVASEIYIRTGFLTDFDPDRRLEEVSASFQAAHINRYGFTVNGAFHRGRRWLQAGFATLLGRGHATGFDLGNALGGESPFYRTTARSRLFLVWITAANDFGKFAQDKFEDIQKKRKQKSPD